MNGRKQLLPWQAISLVLIGLAAVGLVWFLLGPVFAIDKDIVAAVLTSAATLTGVVVTLIVTRRNDRRREAEQRIREAKTPVYEEFMALTLRMALSRQSSGNPAPATEELGEFFGKWFPKALIWASPDVLLAIARWKRQLPATSSPEANLANYIRLFRILRADLGHDDRNLSDQDLVSLLAGSTWDYIPGTFQP